MFVEAIVLHFIPDYSHPIDNITQRVGFVFFVLSIGDTSRIMSSGHEINGSVKDTEQQFLPLARDRIWNSVSHYRLLVHPQGNLVERGIVIEVKVPESHLEVHYYLKPPKRRVVLA